LIGNIGLSIEASPLLQELLSLTKQFGDQLRHSLNKDDVGNVERWEQEGVSRVNLEIKISLICEISPESFL